MRQFFAIFHFFNQGVITPCSYLADANRDTSSKPGEARLGNDYVPQKSWDRPFKYMYKCKNTYNSTPFQNFYVLLVEIWLMQASILTGQHLHSFV